MSLLNSVAIDGDEFGVGVELGILSAESVDLCFGAQGDVGVGEFHELFLVGFYGFFEVAGIFVALGDVVGLTECGE